MRRALPLAVSVVLLLVFAALSHAEERVSLYKDGTVITSDTSWSGRVEIEGVVLVPEGVKLDIAPGTMVAFRKSSAQYKEEEGEGGTSEVLIPGSGIRVEGKIIAEGEKGKAITFTYSGGSPSPGAWGCIFFDHSKGSIFKHCVFEYSTYTLHSHFSQFDVSRCVIRHNEDGSRLGVSRVTFDHCDIYGNTGKGLNFRQCKNTVRWCNIKENRDGIFLNEKDAACTIEDNNIHGNSGMDLRLGDFHAEDVSLKGNWWGTADASHIAKKVWDREDDPNIGKAVIEPSKAEVVGAGVEGVELAIKWKFRTGGFVDCNPAVDNGVVYFGSWDKKFYAVKADNGEPVWSFQTGDCVDSSPAVADGKVYFGSWDRNIYCLDKKDGKLIWKFEMPPSNFDDHRQSSPFIHKGALFIGGFNGSLYQIDKLSGNLIAKYLTKGPIRAKPIVATFEWHSIMAESGVLVGSQDFLIFGSGDGCLYVRKLEDSILRRGKFIRTKGAVYTTPTGIDNLIYFGSQDGNLYCVYKTSDSRWSYNTGSRIEYSSPLIAENLVLIGDCNGTLHAVNKDSGKLVWKFTGGGGIYSSPQAVKDMVVYGDNAGNVYCLDLKTGRPMGLFRAVDAVQGLSTGPDGTIYAGSRDGYLYALSLGQ